ncbi:MAG: hypothetical protein JST05_00495 [Acidobacteria bacterium]|nr:hypothetical protein [Acidobacteriota bacterium]
MTPPMPRKFLNAVLPSLRRGLALAGLPFACGALSAQQANAPLLTRRDGIAALDYEVIPVQGGPSLDLMGFHYLKPLNGWLYLGVGGHAPVLKGDYGGFMAFDATLHIQKKLAGNLFADGGLSVGGGGGGKSIHQSAILSGSGHYLKKYIGLGYDFRALSVGLNYTGFQFTHSAIHHSQFDVYLQMPFSFSLGPYGHAGDRWLSLPRAEADDLFADAGESMFTQSLEHLSQIKPAGTNKRPIDVFELQFSHFLGRDWYFYAEGGAGYHGLPAYNQVLGGIGYRVHLNPRFNLYAQVAAGSGGYAPSVVDTGPGLLVYPKVAAEYALDRNWGVALSGGYLFAPRGTSRNAVLGASLYFHPFSTRMDPMEGGGSDDVEFQDRRLNVFVQSDLDPTVGGKRRGSVSLLTAQYDTVLGRHWYLPVQVGVAFLGYPGYGEVLVGVGAQTPDRPGASCQGFAQILVGANLFGLIAKPEVGVLWGLGPHATLRLSSGKTLSLDDARSAEYPSDHRFQSTTAGLGLSYRFSLPN